MEVGEKNRVDSAGRKPHERQVARCTVSGVHNIDPFSGNDENARPGPFRVWHGATRAAEADVKAIRLLLSEIERNVPVNDPFRKDEADLPLEQERDSREKRQDGKSRQQDFPHG
jgi:hypothetical protein